MKRPKISEAIATHQIKAFRETRGIARLAATATKHDLYIAPSSSSATILNYGGSNAPASLIFSGGHLLGLHPANNLLNLSTTEPTL